MQPLHDATHHTQIEQGSSGKKTLSAYITGLVLSVILTLIAFALVEKKIVADAGLYVALSLLAVLQLIVQSVCFLRLNSSREGLWNLLPFIFAVIIISILVGGTFWIMYNLNYNMVN